MILKKFSKLFSYAVRDKYTANELKVLFETKVHTEFALVYISNSCSFLLRQVCGEV